MTLNSWIEILLFCERPSECYFVIALELHLAPLLGCKSEFDYGFGDAAETSLVDDFPVGPIQVAHDLDL